MQELIESLTQKQLVNIIIFLEDDINELSNMIKSALATSGCHFERKNIKEKFDQMAELINKL